MLVVEKELTLKMQMWASRQNAFDSFSIEQDIEEANKRCSALVRDEVFSFEKALEGIIN